MTYAHIENGIVVEYPVYEGDIRLRFPQTSFTVPFVPPDGFVAVIDQPPPQVDYTQNVVDGIPDFIDGQWVRQWVVTSATPEQINERIRINANYRLFWDALLDSNVYGAIRAQSMVSLPMNTLATEFIALLGDAKAGRPNETAIQASMEAILSTGTFTADHLGELSTALAAGKLDGIYTL